MPKHGSPSSETPIAATGPAPGLHLRPGLLEAVLNHTHVSVVVLDTRFNFLWVNSTYAAACRHEQGFFPGKNHFALYPNAENEHIFRQVVETGEPFFVTEKPFEFQDQPERGVTYWDWSLVPLEDPDGARIGLVFTLDDVTERVRSRQALDRHTRELEAFNDALVGREQRIIELKIEVNRLSDELGRALPYPPVWEHV